MQPVQGDKEKQVGREIRSISLSPPSPPYNYSSSYPPSLPYPSGRLGAYQVQRQSSQYLPPQQILSANPTPARTRLRSSTGGMSCRRSESSPELSALAMILPRTQEIRSHNWEKYYTTVLKIREKVGVLVDLVRPTLKPSVANGMLQSVVRTVPKSDLHVHISGCFSLPVLRNIIVKKRLWFDPETRTCHKEKTDKYHVSYVEFEKSGPAYAQFANAAVILKDKKDITIDELRTFHIDCFRTTDSVLDCLPLVERFGIALREAQAQNCIHVEFLHQGPVEMPTFCQADQAKLDALEVLLANDYVKKIPKNERKKHIDEVATRLQAILSEYICKSAALKGLIDDYRTCDRECGHYLVDDEWEFGDPALQVVAPISSGTSPVSACIIREIDRGDPSHVSFFWHALCAHHLFQECRPLVRAISPVGDESKHTAIANIDVQLLLLTYLQEKFKYPHLTIHAGEFAKDGNDPAARNRVKKVLELANPDRLSHCLTIRSGEDELAILDTISERNIGIECAFTSARILSNFDDGEHPFGLFWDHHDLDVAIVTDDAGVFNATLSGELVTAFQHYSIRYKDLLYLNRSALNMAYLADICDTGLTGVRPNENSKRSIYEKMGGYLEIQENYLQLYDPNWDPLSDEEIRSSPKLQKMIQFERAFIRYEESIFKLWKGKYEQWVQFHQWLKREYYFLPAEDFDRLYVIANGDPKKFMKMSLSYAQNGKTQLISVACQNVNHYLGQKKSPKPTRKAIEGSKNNYK